MHSLKRIQRQENILYSLKRLDYLTRSQIQAIHKLGGKRNANKVLNKLETVDGVISSFRNSDKEKIYHLNKTGREIVDATKLRRKTHLANHFIMRNQYYIHCGMPHSWDNEIEINNKLVCDATYIKEGHRYFVEVDNLQSFKANLSKIKRYKEIREQSSEDFTLIWVASTHARKQRLERRLIDFKSYVYVYHDLL